LTQPPDLARRVAKAEADIDMLRAEFRQFTDALPEAAGDAAPARHLAAAADRDVARITAKIDAQTRLFEALRETQVEHGRDISALRADVGAFRAEVTGRFDQVHGGVERLAELIGELIRRGESGPV
jgi:chromosome segregation ATPase